MIRIQLTFGTGVRFPSPPPFMGVCKDFDRWDNGCEEIACGRNRQKGLQTIKGNSINLPMAA